MGEMVLPTVGVYLPQVSHSALFGLLRISEAHRSLD